MLILISLFTRALIVPLIVVRSNLINYLTHGEHDMPFGDLNNLLPDISHILRPYGLAVPALLNFPKITILAEVELNLHS